MASAIHEIESAHGVHVDANGAILEGDLVLPQGPRGIVLFAHGSGSSRHSPRNQFVAERLRVDRMGTLLLDLLTAQEEKIDDQTREHRFDIPLLAERLGGAMQWLAEDSQTQKLPIGLFGASTGAAAALLAAARAPARVKAVVSRGGRPDLAGDALQTVICPALLIVGSHDEFVIDLNRKAQRQLNMSQSELVIVPGAGHLFEEPGTLEEVARLAANWFSRHLASPTRD